MELARAGDETLVSFSVKPPARAAASKAVEITPTVIVGEERAALREDLIDYPHIPPQLVLRPSKVRLAAAELVLPKGRIGYIEGSGDTLVEDLAHVGVQVTTLDDETLRSGSLTSFSAILVGIRAYNTRSVLRTAHARLMRYVEQGGTLVVQYNTHSSFSPLDQVIGPYPLELGRDRVTDEKAEMRAITARDPLLMGPNRIGPKDFEGWVQERGLYFASKWDERYRPVFEMADPGEAPVQGSTLVAKHGRGRYIYTGLSFFRQLPAGVVGGYRLLLNFLSR